MFVVAVKTDTEFHFKVMDEDIFSDDVVGEHKCSVMSVLGQNENETKEYELDLKYNDG